MEEGQGSLCGLCGGYVTLPVLGKEIGVQYVVMKKKKRFLKELAMSMRLSTGCGWFRLEESEPYEEGIE